MDIYARSGQTKKEEGETTMHQDSLNELEAAMLKKRLKFLRAQGATGKSTYRLGDDFFKQMEDRWIVSARGHLRREGDAGSTT